MKTEPQKKDGEYTSEVVREVIEKIVSIKFAGVVDFLTCALILC